MVFNRLIAKICILIASSVTPQCLWGQASVDAANLNFSDRVKPASLVDTDLGPSLAYTKFSSYAPGTDLEEYITKFGIIRDEQLVRTIERVVAAFGPHDHIKSIRVALYLGNDMPGAAFVDDNGTAYLVVTQSAVNEMRGAAGGREDTLITFLAHELSHIFNQSWGQLGSNQENAVSQPAGAIDLIKDNLLSQKRATEINADFNSGLIAQGLRVSLADAVKPLDLFAPEVGNATYPSRGDRKKIVEKGWMTGCRNTPDNCAEASFDSALLREQARNNIVVGVLDVPDEAPEDFKKSFGEIFYEVLSAAAQSHFKKRTSVIDGFDLKRLAFVPAVLPSNVNAALADQAYAFGQQFDLVAIVNSDVDWDTAASTLEIASEFFVVGVRNENQTYFYEDSRVDDTYRSPRRYAKKGQVSTRWGNMAALAKAIDLIEEVNAGGSTADTDKAHETIRQLINLAVLDLRCPPSGQVDELVNWIQSNAMTSSYLTIDLGELCGF